MSIEELFEIVASGKVTAPVGTRTLALMSVDAEGNFQMAGQTNKNDALRIAYLMMKQVFEPKERGKDADSV